LTIRTARLDELDALREIHRRASYIWPEDRANLDAHPEIFGVDPAAVAAGRVRVAVDRDGSVVGFATWSPAGDVAELEDLFVEPDRMRGGIGTALVGDAAERAARAGVARLAVVAHPRTLAFYGRLGFADEGPATTRFGPARRLTVALPLPPG
jgi:GNAT superfamily N-acetyltransferase